tara:strand:- start:1070 stop:1441 length:372 start_codon:yes stop_codon:yes gene_type:complete
MNCFKSKNKIKSRLEEQQDEIFDLLDQDGDFKLQENEIDYIAKKLLEEEVTEATARLSMLRAENPVQHLKRIVKSKEITKKGLKKIYAMIPHRVWANDILPHLRKQEMVKLANRGSKTITAEY